MAKRNHLIEGLSGTGRSSVCEELVRRGYTAISTDRAWAFSAGPDTGFPDGPVGHDNWIWDRHKAVSMLEPAACSENEGSSCLEALNPGVMGPDPGVSP
jgi:broad-specificity NMP kinase